MLRNCQNSCSERLLLQSMASNKNACNLRMGGYISNILFIILSLRNVTGNLSQYYLSIIQKQIGQQWPPKETELIGSKPF